MFRAIKSTLGAAVIAASLTGSAAQAASVTIDEAGMDAVFSQASFGSTFIDIMIGAVTQLVAPALLNITTNLEITQLFGNHTGAANEVNFYFVDTISACGITISSSIVGCGETPGNDFVVESSFAAGSFGTEILAHELGHNLGLGHTNGGLMNAFLNSSTTLTPAEVTAIFNSPLVQYDGNQSAFIKINPLLVVASVTPVPLPGTGVLLLGGFGAIGLFRRKRTIA